MENPQGKGRKKRNNPENWQENVRKVARNSGEEYTRRDGVVVPGKIFKPVIECCKESSCCVLFPRDSQEALFLNFWGMKDKNKQDTYILSCLQAKEIERRRTKETDKKRNHSWQYKLSYGNSTHQICRNFLLKLLQISEKSLRTVQQNVLSGNTNFVDGRGKHNNRPRKIKPNVWKMILDHLSQSPHNKSHYCAEKSSRMYFEDSSLTVKLRYNSFRGFFEEKTGTPLQMKYSTYH